MKKLLFILTLFSQCSYAQWYRIGYYNGTPTPNPTQQTQKWAGIDSVNKTGWIWDNVAKKWISANGIIMKGDKGDAGTQGATGQQGIQGVPGIQGVQGIQGIKGDKGDPGQNGTGTLPFLTPEQFGAKGCNCKIIASDLNRYSNVGATINDTYDWAAIQQANNTMDATGGGALYFNSGTNYTLSRDEQLPIHGGKYYYVGNDCKINLLSSTGTCFKTGSPIGGDLSVMITGFNFNLSVKQNGINLGRTYGSLVQFNSFTGGNVGIWFKWTMGSAITNNLFNGQDSISILIDNFSELCPGNCLGAYGSNVTTITSNRVYGSSNTKAGYWINASAQVVMTNNVSEGTSGLTDVYYDARNTAQYKQFTIRNHWFEHQTACSKANLFIRSYGGIVNIDGIFQIGGSGNWLEVENATSSNILIQNTSELSGKIKNTTNNTTFTFINNSPQIDFNLSEQWSQNKPTGARIKIY